MITPEQIVKTSEDSHCKALMCWCALNIKQYSQLRWLTHIPNGGSRDIREGAKFKAIGVKPGFPDYFLAYPRYGEFKCCGLYIEMKIEKYRNAKNGGCSDDQLEWLDYLNNAGYKAIVCYGWIEARDAILEYLK